MEVSTVTIVSKLVYCTYLQDLQPTYYLGGIPSYNYLLTSMDIPMDHLKMTHSGCFQIQSSCPDTKSFTSWWFQCHSHGIHAISTDIWMILDDLFGKE